MKAERFVVVCRFPKYSWVYRRFRTGFDRSTLAIRTSNFCEFKISSRELIVFSEESREVDCLIIGQLNNK